MIIHHYTNKESFKDIESSGVILPLSPRSAIAQIPLLGRFLPKSYTEKGLYGIRDEDITLWNSDSFALNHFAQLKSKNDDLIKITFEIPEDKSIEVLEEKILYYEVLPLADKYDLKKSSWFKFFLKAPLFAREGIRLYSKYVQSKVPITEYDGTYVLPVTFTREKISLEDSLQNIEYIKHQESFERL